MTQARQGPSCPRCAHEASKAHGSVRAKKRWQCLGCGFSFTRTTPRGHPAGVRHQALKLYASGVSMNRTGQLVGVGCQSIMRWVRQAGTRAEAALPAGRTVSIEADDMHHYLEKKPVSSGCSRRSTP